jgi:hypothetical protein
MVKEINIMGGRGAAAQNNSGSGKGTGKGKEILKDLLSGKTVRVQNPDNGVIFDIQHLGQDRDGRDKFKSTVKENPKNAYNPRSILTTLSSGTTSTNSYNLNTETLSAIEWLNRLKKV